MRDHFGNMCERVGQRCLCRRNDDDDVCVCACVCVCVAVDLYRSLISEHQSNATVRREQKTEKGRRMQDSSRIICNGKASYVVEREFQQQCRGTHLSPDPLTHTVY